MQRFLIIKTSSLGDILQTLPLVLALKKHYPEVAIDWVVEKPFAPFLAHFTAIDRIIISDFKTWKKNPFKHGRSILKFIKALRGKGYEMSFDFQGNLKSGMIQGLAKSRHKRGYSFKSAAEWPSAIFSHERFEGSLESSTHFLFSLLKDLLIFPLDYTVDTRDIEPVSLNLKEPWIVLGFGSVWPSKQLSMDQVIELIHQLKRDFCLPILIPVLPQEEKRYALLIQGMEDVHLLIHKDFSSFIPYLQKAHLFVGVDSAFLHLARLLKVHSIGLFGPSSKSFYGLFSDLQGSCPYGQSFVKRCKRLRTCSAPCIKNLDLSKVKKD